MAYIDHTHQAGQVDQVRLRRSDLIAVDHEPRIPDLVLAGRLGYEKPHNVRKLIERNRDELAQHGLVVTRPSTFLHGGEKSGRTGRPGTAFLLNEGQALVICALSRTPIAARVRQDIIAIYMAVRGGGRWLPPRREAERYAFHQICEHGHAFPLSEPVRLSGTGTTMARHLLVVPASDGLLDALAGIGAEDEDLEEEPDAEAGAAVGESQRRSVAMDDEAEDDDPGGFGGYGSATEDDEPSLGWPESFGRGPQLSSLGLRIQSLVDGEPEWTAPERAGKGFVRCGPDDAEDEPDAEDEQDGEHDAEVEWVSGFGPLDGGSGL